MADNVSLRQAARTLGATCRAYVQAEDNCRGTVAWWVRARLRSKSIWGQKYFADMDDPADPGVGQRRSVGRELYAGKEIVHVDRGLEKSRLLAQIDSEDELLDYILEGARWDKLDRSPKPAAGRLVRTILSGPLGDLVTGDDAAFIGRSFVETAVNRHVSYFSLTTTEAGMNHAIGLDGTASPTMLYFDPNIGEFTFRNVVDLVKWWRQAYVTRDSSASGAFRILSTLYRCFHFARA